MPYYVDSEEGPIKEGAICPECGSTHTNFEPIFRNWRCEDCSLSWDESEERWENDPSVQPD
jgi:rubredoxin